MVVAAYEACGCLAWVHLLPDIGAEQQDQTAMLRRGYDVVGLEVVQMPLSGHVGYRPYCTAHRRSGPPWWEVNGHHEQRPGLREASA